MCKNADLYLQNYDYFLPDEAIARYPISPKSAAKLLVYDAKSGELSHRQIADLPQLLPPCDIFFNDTKVIKARLYGFKENKSKRELFINELGLDFALVQIKGRVRQGELLKLADGYSVIVGKNIHDTKELYFFKNKSRLDKEAILTLLDAQGHIPLPPYMKRQDEAQDEQNYQSIFAKNKGAVAAPTASLHFDKKLIQDLKKSHHLHTITLHVGAGTFKSVKTELINDHLMHSEYFHIPDEALGVIKSQKALLSIGTTVTRSIEYFARTGLSHGKCDLFLNPTNRPIRVNHLLTNFHLPKSSLIMLVSAFIGREKTLALYEIAKKQNYRFYSYGDAMLLLNTG